MTRVRIDHMFSPVLTGAGFVDVGAKFSLCAAGTTSRVDCYWEKEGGAAHRKEVETDLNGRLPAIYVDPGHYRVNLKSSSGESAPGFPMDHVTLGNPQPDQSDPGPDKAQIDELLRRLANLEQDVGSFGDLAKTDLDYADQPEANDYWLTEFGEDGGSAEGTDK